MLFRSKTILSGYLNIRDLLGYDKVLLSKDALEYVELWLTPRNVATDNTEEIEDVEEEVLGDADGAPEETEG